VSGAFIVRAAPARAQTNANDTLLLAQRIMGFRGNQVTVGALPANWTPTVPLPAGLPILGSIGANGGFVSIYYRPADARQALSAYSTQLTAAGFTNLSRSPVQAATGFAASANSSLFATEDFANFCRDGQNVYVRMSTASNDDLRVEIMPKRNMPCVRPVGPPAAPPVSPLPTLIAPAGTTLVPTSGTTMSVGSAGTMESISSTASIQGDIAVPALLSALASQLKTAGWSVASQLSGRSSAAASLRYQKAGQRWQGWLSILGGVKPQTFIAHIDAVNTGLPSYRSPAALAMGASALNSRLAWVPTKIAKSDEPLLLQFARQIVTLNGYRPAQLYLGRIPPGFSVRIPLPQATPLAGAVVQYQPGLQGQIQYNIYYDLSRAQMQAYSDRLRSLGWKLQPSLTPNLTGFQFAYFPMVQSFCNNTQPPVTIVGARGSSAFVVSVQRIRNGFSCDTMQGLLAGQTFPNPLPRLDAPTGVTMLLANAGVRAGNSGAMLVTSEAIGPLLDAFTTKFTQSGWTLAASATIADIGSRSYTYVDSKDGGQKWQAVLTLYRSFANAGTYYAFVDLTKLPQTK
jgi:hypothetical protein